LLLLNRKRRLLRETGFRQNCLEHGNVGLWRDHVYRGLIWVSYLKFTKQPLLITQPGLLYAIAVGVAFGSVTILLYLTFARVNVSIGSPTIRVMGILIASMLGILLLREPFTWRYMIGLLLTVAGVALIVFR